MTTEREVRGDGGAGSTSADARTIMRESLYDKAQRLLYLFRGVVNDSLTPELVLRIGRIAGGQLRSLGHGRVLLAGDHRVSTDMLKGALASGLQSAGVHVADMGICPSPALAFEVARTECPGVLVDEIVLVVRHHGDQIRAALGEEHLGVPLRYVWQGELRGSGDALLQAREYMTDPTLVILGDVYVARESVELMMEADSEFVLSAAHVDDPENHLGVQIGDYSGVDGVLEAMRLFAERIGRADPAGLEHQIAALGRTGSDHGEPVGMASDHCCTSCVDDPD